MIFFCYLGCANSELCHETKENAKKGVSKFHFGSMHIFDDLYPVCTYPFHGIYYMTNEVNVMTNGNTNCINANDPHVILVSTHWWDTS